MYGPPRIIAVENLKSLFGNHDILAAHQNLSLGWRPHHATFSNAGPKANFLKFLYTLLAIFLKGSVSFYITDYKETAFLRNHWFQISGRVA